MMKKTFPLFLCLSLFSCEEVDVHNDGQDNVTDTVSVSLEEVARLFSETSLGLEQVREVHDAVSGSSGNGYDEEYLMRNLLETPGAGVGDDNTRAVTRAYEKPLKDLLLETLNRRQTRAGNGMSPQDYLDLLSASKAQIYWPESDSWDGCTLPVITFDPMDGSDTNLGFLLKENGEIEEITVTEELCSERPVWVVNNNEDSGYTSLEILRRKDPNWGSTPGGKIIVGGSTRSTVPFKSLVLKDFTMLRNYDSWFAGASEFFVKLGSVDGFTASTEAELKLYSPSITDFMIVVKRKELGIPKLFNAILVSEWTDQLSQCAFMIIEDDGGTVTSWKCSAVGKYNSKSYGFELEIPYRDSDDIVWRGSLSRNYLVATSGSIGHFGDVDLTFELVDITE